MSHGERGGEGGAPDPGCARPGFLEGFVPLAAALLAWAHARIGPALRSRVDPEDVLQEVCVRAYQAFDGFDPARASFRSWIFGIANNVLRETFDDVRRRGATPASQIEGGPAAVDGVLSEATSVSRRVARDEGVRRMLRDLDLLDREEKRLLVYRGLEGLAHKEVAELLGVTVATAEKRWQRLVAKLEPIISPERLLLVR